MLVTAVNSESFTETERWQENAALISQLWQKFLRHRRIPVENVSTPQQMASGQGKTIIARNVENFNSSL